MVNLLEGTGGIAGIHEFDSDGDLAIDRVELDSGTDPKDATSIPGRAVLPFSNTTIKEGAGWYRGELHAYSRYGGGEESVGELIARAEKTGLDFLAITDRNTIQSVHDPAYKSNKLALIPAMEWGTDDQGVALVYGPRTMLDLPSNPSAAQAECLRVQAQGAVFAVAHPCFPTSPWKWGLSYVNAVEVWCKGWRAVPPMTLDQLPEDIKVREDGLLVHSIAAAAAASQLDSLSANVQATRFWDYELVRGLMASGIAGSGSSSAKVPLGQPVTYIYAENQSPGAILQGLRYGRTYMSRGLDGPKIAFGGQVMIDGKPQGSGVTIGGALPVNSHILFEVEITNAVGKKMQVLLNGRPIYTKVIEGSTFKTRFPQNPTSYSVYRVRVIGEPTEPGHGTLDVLAMSSPIYAQDITQEILRRFPNLDVSKTWLRIPVDEIQEVELPEHMAPMQVD